VPKKKKPFPEGSPEFSIGDLVEVTGGTRHRTRGVIYRVGQVNVGQESKGRFDRVSRYTYVVSPVFGLMDAHVGQSKLHGMHQTYLKRIDIVDLGRSYAEFGDFIRDYVKARGKGVE
jgi:hypothetical protein